MSPLSPGVRGDLPWAPTLELLTGSPIIETIALPIGEVRRMGGTLVLGTRERGPREQMLLEARNEARLIVARGLAREAEWAGVASPADLLEGRPAAIRLWRALIGDGRCPHPEYLKWAHRRGGTGGCEVCGLCYHRVVAREDMGGRNIGWCEDCMEERHISEWR